jgi:hypothetical protein
VPYTKGPSAWLISDANIANIYFAGVVNAVGRWFDLARWSRAGPIRYLPNLLRELRFARDSTSRHPHYLGIQRR